MRRIFFLALPLFALHFACSSDADETTSSAAATSGATAASSGSTTASGTGGGGVGGEGQGGQGQGGEGGAQPIGGDRPVDVFVPSSYDGSTAVPLVILLHGYSATGNLQELYFNLQDQAEEKGFLYVHPDGLKDAQNNQFWNASDACCDFANTGVDDSAYLASLVDEISAQYAVDAKRVFFVGHSNGGFMSYRMACDHADKIAAIVSLAGAMPLDTSLCQPSAPVAVLQIHGTADDTILYDGGSTLSKYPSAQQSVDAWVNSNGCNKTPDLSSPPLDLDTGLAGDETSVSQWKAGCQPGGDVELWTLEGGGHIPALSSNFAPGVIDFLLSHPKP
jgi:polyhydroxybutyrate depolymerase